MTFFLVYDLLKLWFKYKENYNYVKIEKYKRNYSAENLTVNDSNSKNPFIIIIK